jgi:hypothetical protein
VDDEVPPLPLLVGLAVELGVEVLVELSVVDEVDGYVDVVGWSQTPVSQSSSSGSPNHFW